MQRSSIFRSVALERLSTPDRLDELLQVTTAKAWLGLLSAFTFLVFGLLWAVYGEVPTTVAAQGVLMREGSIAVVQSPVAGQVSRLDIAIGEQIIAGQAVAEVTPAGGRAAARVVRSVHAGRVLEVRVNRGDVIQSGDGVVTLEAASAEPLEAVLYLPPAAASRIEPGMEVHVSPASVKREEHGMIVGRVERVGRIPASRAAMRRMLGSEEVVESLVEGGAVIEIRVRLLRSATTTTGYRWTSTTEAGEGGTGWLPSWLKGANKPRALGPAVAIESGVTCEAAVIVDRRSPLSIFVGRFGGGDR